MHLARLAVSMCSVSTSNSLIRRLMLIFPVFPINAEIFFHTCQIHGQIEYSHIADVVVSECRNISQNITRYSRTLSVNDITAGILRQECSSIRPFLSALEIPCCELLLERKLLFTSNEHHVSYLDYFFWFSEQK